jgi:hypothetical protein
MRHPLRKIIESDSSEAVKCPRARVALTREKEWYLHIFDDAQRMQQLERLEDEAHLFAAQGGQLNFG